MSLWFQCVHGREQAPWLPTPPSGSLAGGRLASLLQPCHSVLQAHSCILGVHTGRWDCWTEAGGDSAPLGWHKQALFPTMFWGAKKGPGTERARCVESSVGRRSGEGSRGRCQAFSGKLQPQGVLPNPHPHLTDTRVQTSPGEKEEGWLSSGVMPHELWLNTSVNSAEY